jgi:hypothetical protein
MGLYHGGSGNQYILENYKQVIKTKHSEGMKLPDF